MVPGVITRINCKHGNFHKASFYYLTCHGCFRGWRISGYLVKCSNSDEISNVWLDQKHFRNDLT